MKLTFSWLGAALLFFSLQVNAQNDDSLAILLLYSDFESTVKNKQKSEHLKLYAYEQAPVYIVKKNPTGPSILGLMNVHGWVNSGWPTQPYELAIADITPIIDSSFAITDAYFEEKVNHAVTADGRDMFGYIKTNAGWKLFLLHNTVVFGSDTNDYSIPDTLPNTVESVIDSFKLRFDNKQMNIADLFLRNDNQVMVFDHELDSNYQSNDHQLIDFLNGTIANGGESSFHTANISVHYVDSYLASVFCDYAIKDGSVTLESGRAWFTLMGTKTDGWRLSSFIRNRNYQVSASLNSIPTNNSLIHLEVFPNPVTESTQLKVDLVHGGEVHIALFDMAGKQVDVLFDGELSSGKHQIRMKQGNGLNGIYILKLKHSKGEVSHKVLF